MGLRIDLDREACIGAANCLRAAPGLFEIDDEGLAVVLDGAEEGPIDVLLAAVRECPVGAITVAGIEIEEPNECSPGRG